MILLLAAPIFAQDVRVTFKGEDDDDKIELISLEGRTLTFKNGSKPETVSIDDFVPESAFLIKQTFSGNDDEARLELARFALHRGLFEKARNLADQLAESSDEFRDQGARLGETARTLQADAMLNQAEKALDERDTEMAKPLLERVMEQFPDTRASVKSEVLLGTLRRVELEVRALELEKEARAAQQEADEEESRRRAPIDDWLDELSAQVATQERVKEQGDAENAEGKLFRGLSRYEDAVEALKKIRKSLNDNRDVLTFQGQDARADDIDKSARDLMIECYYIWAKYLFESGTYRTAATVCRHGIALAPKDRRLLSLKVDIDLWYDPLDD